MSIYNRYASVIISGSTTASIGTKGFNQQNSYIFAPYIPLPATSLSGFTFSFHMPPDFVCPNCGSEEIEMSYMVDSFLKPENKYKCDGCDNNFSVPITRKEYKRLLRKKKLKRIIYENN